MSTEAALWRLMRGSRLPGHWVRVENRVDRGTPDVNFCYQSQEYFRLVEGWLELKVVTALPRRDGDPVLAPHFTRQQRFWLRQRERAGGGAGMLLRLDRAGPRYLVLDGEWAAEHVGRDASQEDLMDAAACHWEGAWDLDWFLDGLEELPGMLEYNGG